MTSWRPSCFVSLQGITWTFLPDGESTGKNAHRTSEFTAPADSVRFYQIP